jgi:hypothetical protein
VKTSPLPGLAALLSALVTTGCSAGASARPEVHLSVRDGLISVRPDDVGLYVCADGVFFCEDAIGRTSERLCRCAVP